MLAAHLFVLFLFLFKLLRSLANLLDGVVVGPVTLHAPTLLVAIALTIFGDVVGLAGLALVYLVRILSVRLQFSAALALLLRIWKT